MNISRLLRKLRWLSARRRKEADLRDELAFHLDEEAAAQRAAGLSEPSARLAARRDLGSLALIAEDTRAVWGWPLLEQIWQDLRYAVRALRRHRGSSAAAAITLALGIGVTTAIFTVVHGVILRPLPFHEPDRLVSLNTVVNGAFDPDKAVSPPNFTNLREESRAFTDLVGYWTGEITITGHGEARREESAWVSAPFFDLLGAEPAIGRTFDRDANEPGCSHVVVLGHTLWQQLFGGDATAIGRAIRLDGVPHTVIGVMPAGFDFPNERALWIPIAYDAGWAPTTTEGRSRNWWLPVVGRLRPGTTMEMARAELATLGQRLRERFPAQNTGNSFTARPLHDALVGNVRTPLLMLLGAVALVLCIVCANVAGLLLARAASRREEVAIRAALGASRARIVRQLLTESLVLSVGGGLIGLALAFWGTDRLLVMSTSNIPRADAMRANGTVLAYALGVTILTGVLAGLAPSLRAAGDAMAGALRTAGRSGLSAQRGRRLRSTLVVGQLALAVVLLIGASLFLRSFVRLTNVDLGFRAERVVSFRLSLPGVDYATRESIDAFYARLLERLGAHPGVESVGIVFRRPPVGRLGTRFSIEGRTRKGEEPTIGIQVVTPDYFRTMSVPIVRGRGLADTDRAGVPGVVVINAAAARQFFPGEDPIGRRIGGFFYDPVEHAAAPFGNMFTIVGISHDVQNNAGAAGTPAPEVYFAHAQIPLPRMFVVVRTASDPSALGPTLRQHVAALDANLPVTEMRTLERVVSDARARPRSFTVLLSLLSALALTLAAIGIFGLLSFAVAQRTKEIGVRIALGASRRALVGTIVRDALTLVLLGAAIGTTTAMLLSRLVATQLYETSPIDPVAFAGVALVLGVTACLASLVPAWRAASVDPLIALRSD